MKSQQEIEADIIDTTDKKYGVWGFPSTGVKAKYSYSTPPAKKTEPSNLVLRAQDHKKNPKFKGWQ